MEGQVTQAKEMKRRRGVLDQIVCDLYTIYNRIYLAGIL
jgi:hypothetical protein